MRVLPARVVKLHRMYPHEGQEGYWYYDPMGRVQGPFSSEEEMEEEIARYFVEVPHRTDFSTEDWT